MPVCVMHSVSNTVLSWGVGAGGTLAAEMPLADFCTTCNRGIRCRSD